MAYGLTSYGLEIPNYSEWLNEYYQLTKSTFGSDINLADNSIMNKFLGVFAYQDMKIWNVLAATYSSQTLNGAEGIYLDEIFSRRGIFRKPASAASGYATVISDRNAAWTTSITTSYSFTDSNGNVFNPVEDQSLSDRVSAYLVTKAGAVAVASSITFYVTNVETGLIVNSSFNTSSTTFLTDLRDFFSVNLSVSDASKIFVDGNSLYIGFNTTDLETPTGLSTPTKIYSNPVVGTKYSDINVKASDVGYKEVLVDSISTMSPTLISGYVGVTNFDYFNTGADVETDTEYRDRFNAVVDEAVAATRPAIVKAVSDIEDVEKVKIYDNPTSTDTTEAKAYSFNTVVIGGTTSEIANTIYSTKPINTLTDGTTSYTVNTEDDSTEVIKFTYGDKVAYNVLISYVPANGRAFSPTEQSNINSAIEDLSAEFSIGGTIFNAQLQSAVFSQVGYSRLTNLIVYVKKTNELGSAYTTENVTSAFNELATISVSDILYEQLT